MPGSLGSFIDDFISMINELPAQHSMLVAVDFNPDFNQMLPDHVAKVDPLIQNFNLSQCSQYSTHILGGILNLVFGTSNSNTVSSVRLQWSLCFFFPDLIHYIYTEVSCKQFSFQFSLHNS